MLSKGGLNWISSDGELRFFWGLNFRFRYCRSINLVAWFLGYSKQNEYVGFLVRIRPRTSEIEVLWLPGDLFYARYIFKDGVALHCAIASVLACMGFSWSLFLVQGFFGGFILECLGIFWGFDIFPASAFDHPRVSRPQQRDTVRKSGSN